MPSLPYLLVKKFINLSTIFQKTIARLGYKFQNSLFYHLLKVIFKTKKNGYYVGIGLDILLIAIVAFHGIQPVSRLISPLFQPNNLQSLKEGKSGYEVMGFAPHWTFNKLNNVDFNVLTTMAYFGIEVDGEGTLEKSGPGYETFMSPKATEVFQKAHNHGTRVVLTITQMKNDPIEQLMDNPIGQDKTIQETVSLVKARGLDGVNIDFEYLGNPGKEYRDKFSQFVAKMSAKMHQEVPNSRVTVSVYASAVKNPKIYDISSLGKSADGIFMMAYDFATTGSDTAMPTAPLYGYKEKKYWYDISTAVDDFLTQMPSEKLILGVPWYGYNYAVNQPAVKAEVNEGYYEYYKKGRKTYSYFVPFQSRAQTYSIVQNDIKADTPEMSSYKIGWDDFGKVGYKSYYDQSAGTYRMIFIDDVKSLTYKYDFAKDKKLAGVGMWALGFDSGKSELWSLLAEKFGNKLADANVLDRAILEAKK